MDAISEAERGKPQEAIEYRDYAGFPDGVPKKGEEMAIKMNTTQTIERASSALAAKCEMTEKNMEKLLMQAGCGGCKKEKVMLPLVPGSKDDVQYIGLNGVDFYFLRGRSVEMPEPLAEILKNTGHL